MAQTETLHASACLRLGVCRNLVLTAWLDAPEGAHARAMGSAILGVSSRYGLDFGILDTIISGTPRFTDEFRDENVKIMRDSRMQGHGAAHVVTLGGLGGVAVRAFLSTVFLLGRSASPNRVFGEPHAAATWLAPVVSTGREKWTAPEILAAYAEVMRKPIASVHSR